MAPPEMYIFRNFRRFLSVIYNMNDSVKTLLKITIKAVISLELMEHSNYGTWSALNAVKEGGAEATIQFYSVSNERSF